MKPGRWVLLFLLFATLASIDPWAACVALVAFGGGILWGGAL